MKLSIIIPAYNEAKTLEQIIQKVDATILPIGFDKQVIIVNDCSTDATQEIAENLVKIYPYIQVLKNDKNSGKSQSVKNGILKSSGTWVVIQDADLEYEPNDFVFMLEQALRLKTDVAFGNRFGIDNGVGYVKNFVGNVGLSLISNLFTLARIRVYIPDMEVCYKLVKGDIIRKIATGIVSTSNFGFEPEITAKLSRYKKPDGSNLKFVTLPIHYFPRTIAEGKKMHAVKDGLKALAEIFRFNLFDGNLMKEIETQKDSEIICEAIASPKLAK